MRWPFRSTVKLGDVTSTASDDGRDPCLKRRDTINVVLSLAKFLFRAVPEALVPDLILEDSMDCRRQGGSVRDGMGSCQVGQPCWVRNMHVVEKAIEVIRV